MILPWIWTKRAIVRLATLHRQAQLSTYGNIDAFSRLKIRMNLCILNEHFDRPTTAVYARAQQELDQDLSSIFLAEKVDLRERINKVFASVWGL